MQVAALGASLLFHLTAPPGSVSLFAIGRGGDIGAEADLIMFPPHTPPILTVLSTLWALQMFGLLNELMYRRVCFKLL